MRPLACALAALALLSCAIKPRPTGARPSVDPAVLQRLALAAWSAAPDPAALQRDADRIARGELTLDGYIDQLLLDPRFGQTAAEAYMSYWMHNLRGPFGNTLRRTPEGVYFLRKPCAAKDAEPVAPWWAPDEQVRVCADSHRPDVFFSDARHHVHCSAFSNLTMNEKEPVCGCGANLFRCFRDPDQMVEFTKSQRAEMAATFAYVAEHDLPLGSAFTMNETVRDRNAEALYRRSRVEAGESPEVLLSLFRKGAPWDATRPMPRPEAVPGQHAGLLTSVSFTFTDLTPRDRVKFYFEKMWCVEAASVNVDTATIFGLGATDLRAGEGWKKLAAMPICTNCHARIDYGMQFFSGFADQRAHLYYEPREQQEGTGRVYGADIHDLRAEAPLSPQGFARVAVRQPEFGACMAQLALKHVFGPTAEPADENALHQAYAASGTARALMRVALARYAQALSAPPPRSSPPPGEPERPAAAGLAEGDLVPLSQPVVSLVADECAHCHGEGDGKGDFRGTKLPRATLEKMLQEIGYGRMPQDGALPTAQRRAAVAELSALLWTDPASRATAQRYFGRWMRARSIQDLRDAMELVRVRAGASSGKDWSLLDDAGFEDAGNRPSDVTQLTPGYATALAIEALHSCKKAGMTGQALDRCLEHAALPDGLIKGVER